MFSQSFANEASYTDDKDDREIKDQDYRMLDLVGLEVVQLDEDTMEFTIETQDTIKKIRKESVYFQLSLNLDDNEDTGSDGFHKGLDLHLKFDSDDRFKKCEMVKQGTMVDSARPRVSHIRVNENTLQFRLKSNAFEKYPSTKFILYTMSRRNGRGSLPIIVDVMKPQVMTFSRTLASQ